MSEYLNCIKSTVDSLHSIGRPVEDDDIILQILYGLPPSYSDVITVMTARKPLPSFMELRSFLLAHESRLNSDSKTNLDSQALVNTRSSFTNRGHSRGGFNRGGRYGQPRGGSAFYNNQSRTPFRGGIQPRHNSPNIGHSSPGFQGRSSWIPGSSVLGPPPLQCQICDGFSHTSKNCHQRQTATNDLSNTFAGLHLQEPTW